MLPSNLLHTYLQSETDPQYKACLRQKPAGKIEEAAAARGFSSTVLMEKELCKMVVGAGGSA